MAKVKLQNGAEIDTLTASELKEELKSILKAIADINIDFDVLDLEGTQGTGIVGVGAINGIQANGAGVISKAELFKVGPGFRGVIHRIHVNAPGVTPIAPLVAGTGWLTFSRNDDNPANLFEFLPNTGAHNPPGVSPLAPTTLLGGSDAKVIGPGQSVVVSGAGLAANQQFYITTQVTFHKLRKGVTN